MTSGRGSYPPGAPGARLVRQLAVGAAVIGLAACGTSPPGVSNGSVSACYRAIPVGRGAIHDHDAKLIGVHRVALDTVRDRLPAPARAELATENDTAVCALAFHGRFAPGQVQMAPSDQQGPYALVLVSSRKLHLVGAVVLHRLPSSLGARTVAERTNVTGTPR